MIRHSRVLIAFLFSCGGTGIGSGVGRARRPTRPRRSPPSRGSPNTAWITACACFLFPDPTRPKVTVNLTVLVGSRHEGYGETGMAHLLEHMVFKGTPTHPDIPGAMKERGPSSTARPMARSDQLLRDLARHRSKPRVRDPARGRPHGQ